VDGAMKSETEDGCPKFVEYISIFVESCQQVNTIIVLRREMGPVGVDIGCSLISDFGDCRLGTHIFSSTQILYLIRVLHSEHYIS